MGESYYDRLGVPADATPEEIERAYRERLKETHPDVSDDADAAERTKRLIEARETLTDPDERARYDSLGHHRYVHGGSDHRVDGTGTTGADEATAGGTAERASDGSTAESSASDSDVGSTRTSTGAGWTHSSQDRRRNRRRRGKHVRETRAAGEWESTDEPAEAWSPYATDGSYTVSRGTDSFALGNVLSSSRAVSLLGVTVVLYPIMLFGTLTPAFPLAVNLLVAVCVVFVVAFLQSVPEVAVAVFGVLSVLLGPLLVFLPGVSLLSVYGLVAMTAVLFPLGLSVLTYTVIRPVSVS